MSDPNAVEWLSVRFIATRYGVTTATVWRWVRAKLFPEPVRISPRCTRWRKSDVDRWEAER